MEYYLLKDNGITYLPHIQSVWAVKEGRDPAPRFLVKIDQKEVDQMRRRAEFFESKGLRDVVNRIWDSVTTDERNTMIVMYLGTRSSSHPRTSVAHLPPTADEGRRVIKSDFGLSDGSLLELSRLHLMRRVIFYSPPSGYQDGSENPSSASYIFFVTESTLPKQGGSLVPFPSGKRPKLSTLTQRKRYTYVLDHAKPRLEKSV